MMAVARRQDTSILPSNPDVCGDADGDTCDDCASRHGRLRTARRQRHGQRRHRHRLRRHPATGSATAVRPTRPRRLRRSCGCGVARDGYRPRRHDPTATTPTTGQRTATSRTTAAGVCGYGREPVSPIADSATLRSECAVGNDERRYLRRQRRHGCTVQDGSRPTSDRSCDSGDSDDDNDWPSGPTGDSDSAPTLNPANVCTDTGQRHLRRPATLPGDGRLRSAGI